MMEGLNGKHVVITGAASGMGFSTALEFSKYGVKLSLIDLSLGSLTTVIKLAKENGSKSVVAVEADISNEDSVILAFEKLRNENGPVDIAYNNAGVVGRRCALDQSDTRLYDSIMNVNVKGTFFCMREELRDMNAQGCGVIINNASALGLVGAAEQSVYSASKHAIVGMSKSAALDYAKKGIRVNCICPGLIDTPMISEQISTNEKVREQWMNAQPIGRFGRPDEIAKTVVWLSSDCSSLITGVAIAIDGGYTAM